MSALLLVVVCLMAGVLVARIPHPAGLVAALNWWVLNIALPALVLVQITQLQWSASLLWPAAAMWLVFLGAWLYVATLGRLAGWQRGEIGALVLTCGLGNTSFIGYPLIEALRGETGLGIAVVADQLGSFLLLSTLGLFAAAWYAGTQVQPRHMLLRVVRFPAFIALGVAALLLASGIEMHAVARGVLGRIGDTLTPLALFSVGLQLKLRMRSEDASRVVGGLMWKLLLAPLMVLALTLWIAPDATVAAVTVMQAGMAPMITAGILAQQYGLAPVLANRVVGYGIVLSLASVPLIHWMM
ncbi:AEC family transporter [Algiphilus sp.]|uniref:AEC family transporter n=1 Tax=Algiphilus sp. TaxID=1872431 RepID=UPI001CA6C261|nr:AEC family transporter [Algiphilus sp.]MBY8965691.1 AEC family transporter [Algiphilus acroporae]MCI5064078.1 AEC family transporter [Algiphilus sp.]MCI5104127.1 AEC family transporter [Algiphilus sp.]MCR9091351.1 AEC family transporter [Pseudomonadota bacterium]